jgi:hypothetical protein
MKLAALVLHNDTSDGSSTITGFAPGQDSGMTPPSGTPLPVASDEHLSMKVGEPVSAHLLYSVYLGDIIGVAGGIPCCAAGIGYYGAALAFYDRWIARGPQVTFARDTRIVLQTTARHSSVLPSKPVSPNP